MPTHAGLQSRLPPIIALRFPGWPRYHHHCAVIYSVPTTVTQATSGLHNLHHRILNLRDWTGMSMKEVLSSVHDRDRWRQAVHNATKLRSEDG